MTNADWRPPGAGDAFVGFLTEGLEITGIEVTDDDFGAMAKSMRIMD